jgi:DNA-binding NtrC family response regulator
VHPVKTIVFVSARKPDAIIEQELLARDLKVAWANSVKAATDFLAAKPETTGIVTELALLDGNWRDLVDQVRRVSSTAPIVLLSANSTAELWWDALDCDVENFLLAPLSAARLCEILETHPADA